MNWKHYVVGIWDSAVSTADDVWLQPDVAPSDASTPATLNLTVNAIGPMFDRTPADHDSRESDLALENDEPLLLSGVP